MSEDSVRRLVAFLLTSLVIAFNKKLGLDLGPVELAALSAGSAVYIGQSMLNAKAKLEAGIGNVSSVVEQLGVAGTGDALTGSLQLAAGKVIAAMGDAAAAKVRTDGDAVAELKGP